MWGLSAEKIRSSIPTPLPPLAIETGTGRGNGTNALGTIFGQVISIELSQELHEQATRRFSDAPHIRLLQGNSSDQLQSILQDIPESISIFFFLDAHWSGDRSVNWTAARWKGYGMDTAHLGSPGKNPTGPEQCPLLDELRTIYRYCQGRAWILIDDLKNIPADGPGLLNHEFPGEDWSHLSRDLLRDALRSRLVREEVWENPSQWFLEIAPLKI